MEEWKDTGRDELKDTGWEKEGRQIPQTQLSLWKWKGGIT